MRFVPGYQKEDMESEETKADEPTIYCQDKLCQSKVPCCKYWSASVDTEWDNKTDKNPIKEKQANGSKILPNFLHFSFFFSPIKVDFLCYVAHDGICHVASTGGAMLQEKVRMWEDRRLSLFLSHDSFFIMFYSHSKQIALARVSPVGFSSAPPKWTKVSSVLMTL